MNMQPRRRRRLVSGVLLSTVRRHPALPTIGGLAPPPRPRRLVWHRRPAQTRAHRPSCPSDRDHEWAGNGRPHHLRPGRRWPPGAAGASPAAQAASAAPGAGCVARSGGGVWCARDQGLCWQPELGNAVAGAHACAPVEFVGGLYTTPIADSTSSHPHISWPCRPFVASRASRTTCAPRVTFCMRM